VAHLPGSRRTIPRDKRLTRTVSRRNGKHSVNQDQPSLSTAAAEFVASSALHTARQPAAPRTNAARFLVSPSRG
jgi:hypothetical protein